VDDAVPHHAGAVEEHQHLRTILARLATLDALTCLYTRDHFLTLAAREVESAMRDRRPISFLVLELDRFTRADKGAVKDVVLPAVAAAISEAVRELDAVARYRSDTFAVMLPETPVGDARLVADRIRERIADLKIRTSKGSLSVTASVGVAGLGGTPGETDTGDLVASALHRADQALRAAKLAGRDGTAVA
jgi:diguanylate cyclase (GGDEF)-like protein